jgi:hypothetical protein
MDVNVEDKVVSIRPQAVMGIMTTYSDGLGKIQKELVQHHATQVQRSSEAFKTLMEAADPVKRLEIGHAWWINAAKGYFNTVNRIMEIGHETIGQIVTKQQQH